MLGFLLGFVITFIASCSGECFSHEGRICFDYCSVAFVRSARDDIRSASEKPRGPLEEHFAYRLVIEPHRTYRFCALVSGTQVLFRALGLLLTVFFQLAFKPKFSDTFYTGDVIFPCRWPPERIDQLAWLAKWHIDACNPRSANAKCLLERTEVSKQPNVSDNEFIANQLAFRNCNRLAFVRSACEVDSYNSQQKFSSLIF